MNRKDWDEAMNLLDDSLINEADQYRPVNKKKKIIRIFAGAAAAVVILGTAGYAIKMHNDGKLTGYKGDNNAPAKEIGTEEVSESLPVGNGYSGNRETPNEKPAVEGDIKTSAAESIGKNISFAHVDSIESAKSTETKEMSTEKEADKNEEDSIGYKPEEEECMAETEQAGESTGWSNEKYNPYYYEKITENDYMAAQKAVMDYIRDERNSSLMVMWMADYDEEYNERCKKAYAEYPNYKTYADQNRLIFVDALLQSTEKDDSIGPESKWQVTFVVYIDPKIEYRVLTYGSKL
ncbi:MAG: hypothetical protein IKO30_11920 [Lachnospiraceae bacterium]|nr:hypothetical protein [Lachnospiraceae bacterium]